MIDHRQSVPFAASLEAAVRLCGFQDRLGGLELGGIQVVDDGRDRQLVPGRVVGEVAAGPPQPVETEARADGEVDLCGFLHRQSGELRQSNQIAGRVAKMQAGDGIGQILGHAAFAQAFGLMGQQVAVVVGQEALERPAQGGNTRAVACDGACDIQGMPFHPQHPDGDALRQASGLDQHAGLNLRRHLVVQRLDRLPELVEAEDVPRHHEGAYDLRGCVAGLLADLVNEADAHAVDRLVGRQGGCDLPAQAMTADLLGVVLAQRCREVACDFAIQSRVVGQVGSQKLVVERDLGIGQQDRDLRPGETPIGLHPLLDRLVVGQVLQRAVQVAGALKAAHVAPEAVEQVPAEILGDGDRLCLQIVVPQHQLGDLVGHLGQQLVPLRAR